LLDEKIGVSAEYASSSELKRTMSSSRPTTHPKPSTYFEALVASSNDAIVTEAMDGTITSFNPAAERLYGIRAEDVVGRPVAEVHPTSQSARVREARMAARRGEYVPSLDATRATAGGLMLELSVGFSPIKDASGEVVGITAIVRDISHRPEAKDELQIRARQQAAVAWFGQRALASNGLDELIRDAVDLIPRTLDVEFVKLLAVDADRRSLRLRAGIGWRPELIGTIVSDLSRSSPAGRALLGGEPVIIANLTNEPTFPGPSFLHDHGIVSGVSVVVRGPDEPFGVLGAHSAVEHPSRWTISTSWRLSPTSWLRRSPASRTSRSSSSASQSAPASFAPCSTSPTMPPRPSRSGCSPS
jgi:PAS domain S-box-containing protein